MSALLGHRPDLMAVARNRWEIGEHLQLDLSLTSGWVGAPEVEATQELVWKPGGKLGNVEDELGPPWVEPNRHCTLMLYLNNPEAGGAETTFPNAAEKTLMMPSGELSQREVVHPGMTSCSRGVRVEPFEGGGALFYHKFGNGKNDVKSMHGGCPPLEGGVAWKINGFMWNTDAQQGMQYFR